MAIIKIYFHLDNGEPLADGDSLLASHVFQSTNVVSWMVNVVGKLPGVISRSAHVNRNQGTEENKVAPFVRQIGNFVRMSIKSIYCQYCIEF